MRILIPSLGFGKAGGYRILSKMSDQLIENGCDVTFIVPENNSDPYYPTKAKIVKSYSPDSHNRYKRFFVTIYYLYMTVRKMPKSIVMANEHMTAYIAFFLPSKFNKFYYIQANEAKLVKGIVAKLVAYLTYLLPLKKIVNADNLLPKVINRFVSVVPAGVDLELFCTTTDATPMINGDEVNIGFIGRKESYKGSNEILLALDKVFQKTNRKININIAVYKPKLPERLSKIVNFSVISNDSDLAIFYQKNDLIVATGLIEDGAFHYPCAEGMACGKLVISNYAPLINTKSTLVLSRVSSDKLHNLIMYALSTSIEDIQREIEINFRYIRHYSWVNVGGLMYRTLKRYSV